MYTYFQYAHTVNVYTFSKQILSINVCMICFRVLMRKYYQYYVMHKPSACTYSQNVYIL